MAKKTVKLTMMLDVNEDTTTGEAAYMVERAVSQVFGSRYNPIAFSDHAYGYKDVVAFHRKFSVPQAPETSFLDQSAFEFRKKFMQEELDEFSKAHGQGDMHGAADGLADLVWVAYGTAAMMNVPWGMVWGEVQRANMQKVRAAHADDPRSKRGSSIDIVKPAGWKAPDHTVALGREDGTWPTFQTGAKDATKAKDRPGDLAQVMGSGLSGGRGD